MSSPPEHTDEISRLADAIDAFLERRHDPVDSDSTFLSRHEGVRDFLEPMLGEAEVDAPARSGPKTLGPYRILREIGRGGMGVVYEAEQDNLRRRVALKVLPPLATLSPRRIERFLREAKAAARLDHPGIARVFDAGEENGTWFYAMELVDGRSLRDAFATIRNACDRDPRRLGRDAQLGIPSAATWHAEIAELGAQVAAALDHAHEHGVLHRDVKPQNIVLGSDGRPRLVDFGLAKDLTEVSLSASDEFAGTPHYVSPEQAEPDGRSVDAQTDVFSLGVVLYELLAMRRPFDGPSTETVLRAIVRDEPRALRLFDPSIPRDLETVVGKALRKSRGERYASAAELAADLRRYLHGEPVLARPVPWTRRMGRYALRHRARATAVVLAFALFVVTPTIVAVLLESARAETAEQRDRADANLSRAWQAVDRLLTRVADEDLPDVPRLQSLRAELLEDARAFHLALLETSEGDPALAYQAARANGRVGRILVELERKADAMRPFGDAIDGLRSLVASDAASVQHRFDLAVVLAERGVTRLTIGARVDGHRDVEEALALWAAIAGEPDADASITTQARLDSARTELRVAAATRFVDRADATVRYERALAIFAELDQQVRADHALLCARAEALILHAIEHHERGERPDATAALDAADSDLEHARERVPDAPRPRILTARALQVRARVAEAAGRSGDAERARRSALGLRRALATEFPTGLSYRLEAAVAAEDLARFLIRTARDGSATELLDSAVADLEAVLAKDPTRVQALHYLGAALTSRGTVELRGDAGPAVVDATFTRAAEVLADAAARTPDALHHRSALGAALGNHAYYLAAREPARALALAERAIEAQQVALDGDPEHPTYRSYMQNHRAVAVDACLRQGDHVAAAEHAEGMLAIPGRGPQQLIGAARVLSLCAWSVRAYPEHADPYIDRAVEVLELLAEEAPEAFRSAVEDPRLARVRGDPRVEALVEEVGR